MKKFLLSTIAVAALISGANAGGKLVEPVNVPAVPVVTDEWSGPYVGVAAGYLSGKGKVDITKISPPTLTAVNNNVATAYDRLNMEPDGFAGGVFAGVNKLLGNDWLIGIEVAANYVNAKDTKNLYIHQDRLQDTFTLKQSSDYAIYGRLGKVMGQDKNVMPYVLAGGTLAKLKGGLKVNGVKKWDSDTVGGWTVGAGVEYKINKKWHVRVQYRFSKYSDAKFKYNFSPDIYRVKVKDYKTHLIQVGLSYHFN